MLLLLRIAVIWYPRDLLTLALVPAAGLGNPRRVESQPQAYNTAAAKTMPATSGRKIEIEIEIDGRSERRAGDSPPVRPVERRACCAREVGGSSSYWQQQRADRATPLPPVLQFYL